MISSPLFPFRKRWQSFMMTKDEKALKEQLEAQWQSNEALKAARIVINHLISDELAEEIMLGSWVTHWSENTRPQSDEEEDKKIFPMREQDGIQEYLISPQTIKEGLSKILAGLIPDIKSVWPLEQILDDKWDRNTGDVIIQVALFNEVRYG